MTQIDRRPPAGWSGSDPATRTAPPDTPTRFMMMFDAPDRPQQPALAGPARHLSPLLDEFGGFVLSLLDKDAPCPIRMRTAFDRYQAQLERRIDAPDARRIAKREAELTLHWLAARELAPALAGDRMEAPSDLIDRIGPVNLRLRLHAAARRRRAPVSTRGVWVRRLAALSGRQTAQDGSAAMRAAAVLTIALRNDPSSCVNCGEHGSGYAMWRPTRQHHPLEDPVSGLDHLLYVTNAM